MILHLIKPGKTLRRNYREIIFVILAFALMVIAANLSVGRILRERLYDRAEEMIYAAEANVRAGLSEAETLLLNSYQIIKNMIEQNAPREEILDYLTTTTEWMRQRDQGLLGFYGIYGYINGEFYDSIGLNPGSDYIPQTQLWYQTAIRSGAAVGYTTPYKDSRTGDTIISAVRNIDVKNGGTAGILTVDINIDWLVDYVQSLAAASGGYGILISQNMTIMAHPDSAYMGLQLQDLGGSYEEIARILRSGGNVSARRTKDTGDRSAIVFFTRIFKGWYVGIVTPYHLFYRDLFISAIILVVLGLALSLALCFMLLRLSAAKMRADEESKSKSSFLATMSHEIRTPMNAIIGIAQIQLQKLLLPQSRKGNLTDEYSTAFEKIYSSGNSLLGIINDILDMSKIETGKMELNPAEYDTPSLINDAVQLNIVRIGSKPIEFKLDIDEKLPSRLYGDELRLKQILNNLLSNAIKYTEKGIIKLSVDHSSQGAASTMRDVMLRFVVEDTGQGMKGEDQKRLFSEYSRFNAEANRSTEGAGLGLNITKKLVEMMDGTIAAESEYGKGSKFTVTVRQEAIECQTIGAELAQRLRNFTFTGDRQTANLQITREAMPYGNVLVVDDVETNLYVAEGLLSPYQLKIETADSGFAAIEKIENGNTYDIIFMDHMMPKMDGIETTEKIRELGYKGVIVALTANALTGNDEMFARHGFDGFISKPIDIRHLNAILNKFVRDRNPHEAKEYAPQEEEPELLEELAQAETAAEIAKTYPEPPHISREAEKTDVSFPAEKPENVKRSGRIRHLFIINPVSKRIKGKTKPVKDKITAFFAKHPDIKYDIYVSEWCRDAVTFIQDYVAGIEDETVRVHSIGGTGTLFEVVNSVAGLSNAEVAAHPYGKANAFLRYFGNKNVELFRSMESQVFGKTVPMDIVRCGNSYGICYGMTGIEAHANVLGDKWIDKGMPIDLSYMAAGMILMLSRRVSQKYFIEIDGDKIEGDFISVMVANAPCYGRNMYPAIDAHPDDGMLDVYLFKGASKTRLLRCVPIHTHGKYRKLPDLVSHYRAKKVKLSSDEVMCMSIDCEHFYGLSMEYEIMPKAVKFVCPSEIDLNKLPRIYNRPQEGPRSE